MAPRASKMTVRASKMTAWTSKMIKKTRKTFNFKWIKPLNCRTLVHFQLFFERLRAPPKTTINKNTRMECLGSLNHKKHLQKKTTFRTERQKMPGIAHTNVWVSSLLPERTMKRIWSSAVTSCRVKAFDFNGKQVIEQLRSNKCFLQKTCSMVIINFHTRKDNMLSHDQR